MTSQSKLSAGAKPARRRERAFFYIRCSGGPGTRPDVLGPDFGATVQANVDVESDLPLSSVSAFVNTDPLTLTTENTVTPFTYTGAFRALQLCGNTFSATAENEMGATTANSTFTVTVPFGGWLPPITTARFQPGRTLPVKFRLNMDDGNGLLAPTDTLLPEVYLNGTFVGNALVQYDVLGAFYQLDVPLAKTLTGAATVSIKGASCLGGYTAEKVITLK